MKNQWRVVIGAVLVLVVVVFAVLNSQSVPVNFGFAKFSGPLILIILGSAIIGVVVGLITSVATILDQNKRIKKLIEERDSYKSESDKLVAEAVEQTQRDNENQLADLQQKYELLLAEQPPTGVGMEQQHEPFSK